MQKYTNRSIRQLAIDFLLFSVAIILVLFCVVRWIGIRNGVPSPVQSAIGPGTRVTKVKSLGLGNAERGLLLVTTSTCHFCRDSMPFYQKLVPLAKRAGARIVAVTAENREVNAAYLSKNGISVDSVLSLSDVGISVRGTPTLILVTSDGVVKKSWVGKVAPKGEIELLSMFQLSR